MFLRLGDGRLWRPPAEEVVKAEPLTLWTAQMARRRRTVVVEDRMVGWEANGGKRKAGPEVATAAGMAAAAAMTAMGEGLVGGAVRRAVVGLVAVAVAWVADTAAVALVVAMAGSVVGARVAECMAAEEAWSGLQRARQGGRGAVAAMATAATGAMVVGEMEVVLQGVEERVEGGRATPLCWA